MDIANAKNPYSFAQPAVAENTLFKDVTREAGIQYRHSDYNFIDFDIQHLLPHKLSEYSPGLASADVDANGLDDVIIGGNAQLPTSILFQQTDGKFLRRNLIPGSNNKSGYAKDEGILIFDANGDAKPDVYISSGGYALSPDNISYGQII